MKQFFMEHHRLFCRVLTLFSGLALAVSIGWMLYRWPSIPETIPSHYDFYGNVESYGSRAILWLLPGINLMCFVIITVSEFFPQAWNTGVKLTPQNRAYILALTRTLIVVTKFVTTVGLVYLSVAEVLCTPLGLWFLPVFLAAIFLPIVVYLVLAVRAK